MWKYLIFNGVWFLTLLLSYWVGRRLWRIFLLLFIFTGAFFVAFKTPMDPITWSFYLIFSCLVFWGDFRFTRWSLAPLEILEEETKTLSGHFSENGSALQKKQDYIDSINLRANEIAHLYDKINEMSRSVDDLEIFLIFGEALAKASFFRSIKLAFFDPEQATPKNPSGFYELESSYFNDVFDRRVLLKDIKESKTTVFPFDEKILSSVFDARQPVRELEGVPPDSPRFLAHPIMIHEKIFAVLVLMDVSARDHRMLSILTERFISEMQRVNLYKRIETLAITDGLTGVYVRRHLLERFEAELERSKKYGLKLSFLMIDVDHFKNFNDQYGHLVGDVVLRQTAEAIRSSVRELDLVGRVGGEEFGVLLIETDESGAFFVAERIRRAVQERIFKAYDESLSVTISIGCAAYSDKLHEPSLIVDAADSALYRAKRQGRNRACLYASQ